MTDRDLLPAVIGAAIETALIAANAEVLAPGLGVVGTAMAAYLLRRRDAAREILRSEFEKVGAMAGFRDPEQLASGLYRYARAARDQAADENLKVLAQAMIGCARRHELWASDFLRYADILAPLSRDELLLLGRFMSIDAEFHSRPQPSTTWTQFWKHVVDGSANLFPSKEHVAAVAARAQRSGLIMYQAPGVGGAYYTLTSIGREVREIVDIEAAVRDAARHSKVV